MLRKALLLGLCIFLLCSCASTIEEGEIDYVRTISKSSLNPSNGQSCDTWSYGSSTTIPAGVSRGCYETLYRKYTSVSEIKNGETISVNLMQAYIKDGLEGKSLGETFQKRGSNAEIVIIANVCEQGISGCSQKFGPQSDKKGRVVFFSNGVKAKQHLNFSYLPVYGPIKYHGNPLIVQLAIIEFDNLSQKEIAMLQSLSDAGKKAYPPASSALSILDKLGKNILERSHDDILFRYTMTLVPEGGDPSYHSPTIAEGNYAFVRKDTVNGYQEKEIWSDLLFDSLQGRLVRECDEKDTNVMMYDSNGDTYISKKFSPCTLDLTTGKSYRDYRDNTYLTFQIKSGLTQSSLDSLQTLEELASDLDSEKGNNPEFVSSVTKQFEQDISRNSNANMVMEYLIDIKKLINNTDDGLALLQRNLNKFINRYEKILKDYHEKCVNKSSSACKALISEEQLEVIYFEFKDIIFELKPEMDTATYFPLEITHDILAKNSNKIIENLLDGYKRRFQRSIFGGYISEFEKIHNLSSHVNKLIDTYEDEELDPPILKDRKLYLQGIFKSYLQSLSMDISYFKLMKCDSSSASEQCYRYPSKQQFNEILVMLNAYIDIEKKADFTTPELDFDTTISDGLTSIKINEIVKGLSLITVKTGE